MPLFKKYKEFYDILLKNQNIEIYNTKYTLFNVFLTLMGVRPACLISLSDISFAEFSDLLSESKSGILVPYKFGRTHTNYILMGPSMDMHVYENARPILNNPYENLSKFHTVTGKIIGYLKPMNIFKETGGRLAGINVNVDDDEIVHSIMPQRVGDATDEEIKAYYKPVMDLLTDLYLHPYKYNFPLHINELPKLIIKDFKLSTGKKTRKQMRRRMTRKLP